jgi:CheY-like chemotaxis protein
LARKILLADDSVTAQNMGRKILADAGYEVITVNNGSAALKKVGEHRPDLIVLDVYMPGYSGLEVCQRLKEAGDTSRIPILLTVGKLEPFKPEEARRVRADAYIVKPFEASELLSALSKLEDKVVPRSEPSKPGRFARATAAIDEGRFDRSTVEEDSGWKSRIVFPKKKEKEQEADADEAAIYNPVNKDLRTVVDHGPGEHPAAGRPPAEEERVNVSALAPEGLPKDVTPEEIAALAAAAAQVKGKIADEKAADIRTAEKAAEEPAIAAEFSITKPENVKKDETPAAEVPAQAAASVTDDAVAQARAEETAKEDEVVPSSSEVTAAIAGLEQRSAEESKKSEDGIAAEVARGEEPATMAVAAAAGVGAPRWTAVAVALSPEEASLSLEQEMQQAASFAVAAKPELAGIASTSSEPDTATMAMVEPQTPVAEALAPIAEASAAPAIEQAPDSQATPSSADVPSRMSEPFRAEVPDFTVAAPSISEEAQEEPSPFATPTPESLASSEIVSSEVISSEKELGLPTKIEEATPADVLKPTDPVETKTAEPETSAPEVQKLSEEKFSEETRPEESPKDQIQAEHKVVPADVSEPIAANEDSEAADKESAAEVSTSDSASPIAGGIDPMAKKESDISATTAAAWASWRKIRETGGSKTSKDSEDVSEPKDEAAKAVAVGAESNPEEVTALDSDPEIANIVDSVLADMRPKIVEEIARKLGKKK